jgi:hypothetical protein
MNLQIVPNLSLKMINWDMVGGRDLTKFLQPIKQKGKKRYEK